MAEFEDISDDSYSDSDVLPVTPPPRIYPAAFPPWASASGEAAVAAAAAAAAAAQAIQDPAVDSSDFSQDDVRPTQPSSPPVEICSDLGEIQWVQNPERKVKVEEEMEGESPPSKKPVFGSSPSTSLSMTEQQTEERLDSPLLFPSENEPELYEFSSPGQSSPRSLDLLFDLSAWESSPPPSQDSFVPESPYGLESQDDSQPCEPDSQSSPTMRIPQPKTTTLEPLDEDEEPCTSTFQVQRTPYREVSPPEEESLEGESECRVSSTAQLEHSPFSACLFDDDSDSEFFFSLVHGKVLPASPTTDQKLGFQFSLSAQESPCHSFDFLFEEDSTSAFSSDVAQGIPLSELLLLETEPDRECSYSQFSPPKAAQVKPLGNMFPEASSFATSSQAEGPPSEALAILKTQQTAAFSPSTERAYRRALEYLFENKPIWEPPSPDNKILVPNTPSPQRKKAVSGLLLSERLETSCTWSLDDPFEDISSCEPSPSGAHEALAPEAFLATTVTVYEFPPTEPVSPPSTSLDALFEDTSIPEFSSQIHEVAPEFPAAVRKKTVYEFSPSKVRPLPPQRSLDFLLEDQAAFEPSSQAHDSDFSESPPLVAKKLVFEVSPQTSPGASSLDFLFEDDIPGSSYPSFLLDDDILRPSSHDFLLDDELPGPSYRSYLLDDELPGPSYRSYLIDDELPGPSYRSYLIDDELPGPSYRTYLIDDELPGPSYRTYLIDDELPGPSYHSYLIDDEVPGPSSSSFLVEDEKARFSSPDFPIEEEETLDYTALLYNLSVSPPSLRKKTVCAPSPNASSAQTIPYIDSLSFLIDDKSAGEPLSQAQEMLSSESPMLGRKLNYEFKPLDLLLEEDSSPEAASIPIHSLVIPATSPGEKYLSQYNSPDFMCEDPSAFQYFPSGVHDLVLPDMTSGTDNYGSQFASSRAQIVTSPSSLDFLLTGDLLSPDPVILLPGSPNSVGERPIFEFFSSQEEKTFCDSTSDQGRLFYDVPLSQNQELEPEFSFRAEQRVAEAFSSHVFFPFEEEMMPLGWDLTSQVSAEQVYECSSTCMPESTDTKATPPQESDDDEDDKNEDGDDDHNKDDGKDGDDGGGDNGGDRGSGGSGDRDNEDGSQGGKEDGSEGGKEDGGKGGKEDGGKGGSDRGEGGSDGGEEGSDGGDEDGGDVDKDSGDIDKDGSNVGDKDSSNINKDSSDADKDSGNGDDADKDSSDSSGINKDGGDNKDSGDNTDDNDKDDNNKDDGDNKDDGSNKDSSNNTDDNDKDDNKDDGDNKDGGDKDSGDNTDNSDSKDGHESKDDHDNKDEKDDEDNKALPMWKETI